MLPAIILPRSVAAVSALVAAVTANRFLLEDEETQLADPTDTPIASLQLSGNAVDQQRLQRFALEAVAFAAVAFRSRIHEWGYGWS